MGRSKGQEPFFSVQIGEGIYKGTDYYYNTSENRGTQYTFLH